MTRKTRDVGSRHRKIIRGAVSPLSYRIGRGRETYHRGKLVGMTIDEVTVMDQMDIEPAFFGWSGDLAYMCRGSTFIRIRAD